MSRKSYLDCPHNRVQQFTECCLDCGYNIYTTEAEYLADLERKVEEQDYEKKNTVTRRKIRDLEKKLK